MTTEATDRPLTDEELREIRARLAPKRRRDGYGIHHRQRRLEQIQYHAERDIARLLATVEAYRGVAAETTVEGVIGHECSHHLCDTCRRRRKLLSRLRALYQGGIGE